MTDLDLDATLAAGEQMCQIFTVGPRGTSWRIDDVSVRAVQAALPALVAALREARAEVERISASRGYGWTEERAVRAERDDWRRRYEALRDGVTGLCDEADRNHEEYLRGIILDRFIVPSNVTVRDLRAVVARVEES